MESWSTEDESSRFLFTPQLEQIRAATYVILKLECMICNKNLCSTEDETLPLTMTCVWSMLDWCREKFRSRFPKIKAGFSLNLLWVLLFPRGWSLIAFCEPMTFCLKPPRFLTTLLTECSVIGWACSCYLIQQKGSAALILAAMWCQMEMVILSN